MVGLKGTSGEKSSGHPRRNGSACEHPSLSLSLISGDLPCRRRNRGRAFKISSWWVGFSHLPRQPGPGFNARKVPEPNWLKGARSR